MHRVRIALALASLLVVATSSAGAQQWHTAPNSPPAQRTAPESRAVRDMRHKFMLVATRATGYFISADSIEANLRERGMSLHPDIIVLRVRVQAALAETQSAIDRGDLEAAGESLDLAQALLDRFASKLGG